MTLRYGLADDTARLYPVMFTSRGKASLYSAIMGWDATVVPVPCDPDPAGPTDAERAELLGFLTGPAPESERPAYRHTQVRAYYGPMDSIGHYLAGDPLPEPGEDVSEWGSLRLEFYVDPVPFHEDYPDPFPPAGDIERVPARTGTVAYGLMTRRGSQWRLEDGLLVDTPDRVGPTARLTDQWREEGETIDDVAVVAVARVATETVPHSAMTLPGDLVHRPGPDCPCGPVRVEVHGTRPALELRHHGPVELLAAAEKETRGIG